MANLFDYITWRGDLDFIQSPFNPVDNIIFSQLSYLPFDGIVSGLGKKDAIKISDAAKILKDNLKSKSVTKPVLMFKKDPDLIEALIASKRFGNCRIFEYINHIDTEREIQISALCVNTGDGSHFVVFRGTDLSFVAWKEDFNMAFCEIIPAQLEAVKYLEKIASMVKGSLRIGGHSKGGNLAIYAASQCHKKIQKRITEIYSNDAPGFHESIITSKGFCTVKDRIISFIPQESIVGMLLEQGYESKVIKSSKIGLFQHELYSWEVSHNNMVQAGEIAMSSLFVDKTIKGWLAGIEKKQREQFIGALYSLLTASKAKSLTELEQSWLKATGRIIKSLGTMDKATKELIGNAMKELRVSASQNLISLLKPKK